MPSRRPALALVPAAMLALACDRAPPAERSMDETSMAAVLARRVANVDPDRNRFANAALVARLEAQPRPDEPFDRLAYDARLGEQLLYAGRLEEGIERFDSVLASVERLRAAGSDELSDDFVVRVLDYLAAGHLRGAVRERCIEAWVSSACTVPVRPEAADPNAAGARRAAALYRDIIALRPDDLGPRWLLNVSAMMLGTYPDGVPAGLLVPPDAFRSEADIGRFPDVARAAGVDMIGHVGGSAMDDFDGDLDLDLIASSWRLDDPLRFFRNAGDGTFVDDTDAAGLRGLVGGGNLVHADYDNDGDLDVFVLRGGWIEDGWPNSLLRNDGTGRFEDVTRAAGLLEPERPSQTAAWADYDGDGWLDLLVGNETFGATPYPLQLFRNQGDGTFRDVAVSAGVNVVGVIKGVVWGDVDNDRRPDAYVTRVGAPNVLLHNDGRDAEGRWRFTDRTAAAGVGGPEDAFPAWFWDFDNDGWLDIFVAGYRTDYGDVAAEYLGLAHGSELPRLYRNAGDGRYEDVSEEVRLDRIVFAMGANYGDLDNDGWPDVFAGTGDALFQALMPNRVFRNDGGRAFQDVTTSGGFGSLLKGHGVSFGDVDHDGDQDVFQVLGGAYEGDVGRAALYRNPGHGHRWLTLLLQGGPSSRSAIGARLRVVVETPAGERTVHAVVGSGGSFGANSLRQEMGLGDATALRSVSVDWPSGARSDFYRGMELDHAYRIVEGVGSPEAVELPPIPLGER